MTLSDRERAERWLQKHEDATAAQLAGGIRVRKETAEKLLNDLSAGHTDTADSSVDSDAEDVDKYRRIYLRAAEMAGREPWEYVEQDAIREALEEVGFGGLLESGALLHNRDWKHADMSEDGEGPHIRWYYPSGNEPRPDEFRRFHELLTKDAPEGYAPHYFRVAKACKDPATQYGSWKTEEARLSVSEAVEWMQEGGNVGIAGRGGCRGCGGRASPYCPQCEGDGCDDSLVNVDIDDDEQTTPDDVPASLRARSRSRTGWHTWYFDEDGDVPNIPTDEYGEIRASWQYVVAPGSFVASAAEEVPSGADRPGYYTIEDGETVANIAYGELPEVFQKAAEEADTADEQESNSALDTSDSGGDGTDTYGNSAVFDVEASDLVTETDSAERFSSIFHSSSTGANMSVSKEKLHCWRHGVAHGGLQALAVLSDQVTEGCKEIGAPHDNSGTGRNRLKGDWQLVWAAWHEAKESRKIPQDDPIPYRALCGIAVQDEIVDESELVERETEDGTYTALPDAETYNCALGHVRETYDVDPGREHHTDHTENRSDYYTHDLEGLAASHNVVGDPYSDPQAMLLTCLYARDQFDLVDAKPPYSALLGVAELSNLSLGDPENRILGESTYKVAERIYNDLEPSDLK